MCPVRQRRRRRAGRDRAPEAVAAYKDPAMSSCVAVAGPFPPLPFTPQGEDITAQIEEHRSAIPMARARRDDGRRGPPEDARPAEQAHHPQAAQRERRLHVATCRPTARQVHRPRRMRVHRRLREAVGNAGHRRPPRGAGRRPLKVQDHFSATNHSARSKGRRAKPLPTTRCCGWTRSSPATSPTVRREPRSDVLTELAAATYPDGRSPDVDEVVKLATFLFAAGTTRRPNCSAPRSA